jgi:PleD family two-component response regulator
MVHNNGDLSGGRGHELSILLASDSDDRGRSVARALEDAGFRVEFAGDYPRVEGVLDGRRFDVVLLDVSGGDAVERAVETALRLKRSDAGQFVGYLADASLNASGLGGDGIFPRSASKLPAALRSRLAAEGWGALAPEQS